MDRIIFYAVSVRFKEIFKRNILKSRPESYSLNYAQEALVLTFPQALTFRDIIVFPDDEDPNLFYPMSGMPRLRVDNGRPVFRGLFWTDQADGAAGSVAG